MANGHLQRAKDLRDDEYYTRRIDVDKELELYRDAFRGKVVFCNCDSDESAFVSWFRDNYDDLGLGGLLRMEGNPRDDVGDFRSWASMDLLRSADIVVSNPPFSLLKAYMRQLVEFGKDFLIVVPMHSLIYREIFPMVRAGDIRVGYHGINRFYRPDGGVSGVVANWLTTLPVVRGDLELTAAYDPDRYPRYDNYDAIEVGRLADIPADYDGVMGVPLTFLKYHNPLQFDIVDATVSWSDSKIKRYPRQVQVRPDGSTLTTDKLNAPGGGVMKADPIPGKTYYRIGKNTYINTFARVLIRRANA